MSKLRGCCPSEYVPWAAHYYYYYCVLRRACGTHQTDMTKFRPCIDLHCGQVKQIVGGTLSNVAGELKTNYVSELPASHYAALYRDHGLRGGHVVMLGPGNDDAARDALSTWPGGLQVAGGITDKNAQFWIDRGAEKVREKDGSDNVCPADGAAGHRHLVSFPRGQVLARPARVGSTRSGRRHVEAGLGPELSEEA